MKKNRRLTIWIAALAVIMALSSLCVGCGSNGQSGQDQTQAQAQTTTQTQTTAQSRSQQTGEKDQTTEKGQNAEKNKNAEKNGETSDKQGKYGGKLDPNGTYDSKDQVAEYLYEYERLPRNYMTKKEARKLGWQGGSLEKYAPGMCIGGDFYGNYEGLLPNDDYHECDIDTLGKKSRGAKRLVFSDDEIYYTGDHYSSFELLYDKNGKH